MTRHRTLDLVLTSTDYWPWWKRLGVEIRRVVQNFLLFMSGA